MTAFLPQGPLINIQSMAELVLQELQRDFSQPQCLLLCDHVRPHQMPLLIHIACITNVNSFNTTAWDHKLCHSIDDGAPICPVRLQIVASNSTASFQPQNLLSPTLHVLTPHAPTSGLCQVSHYGCCAMTSHPPCRRPQTPSMHQPPDQCRRTHSPATSPLPRPQPLQCSSSLPASSSCRPSPRSSHHPSSGPNTKPTPGTHRAPLQNPTPKQSHTCSQSRAQAQLPHPQAGWAALLSPQAVSPC